MRPSLYDILRLVSCKILPSVEAACRLPELDLTFSAFLRVQRYEKKRRRDVSEHAPGLLYTRGRTYKNDFRFKHILNIFAFATLRGIYSVVCWRSVIAKFHFFNKLKSYS